MIDSKLSLILPAHNEADNIEHVVDRCLAVLPEVVSEHEIIVVNDGSSDFTGDIINQLDSENSNVRALHHEVNQGYGSALRSGFDAATGDLIMFMDADRQFDIGDLTLLAPHIPNYDIVAGYRIRRQDALYRRVYAKIFDIAVLILFGLHMRDVDCAFKVYRADLVKAMSLSMPGALINTEMLTFARRMGASLVEVGVNHYPRFAGSSSGGSPRVVFRAMGETLSLWWKMRSIDVPRIGSNTPPPARLQSPALAAVATVVITLIGYLVWRRRK